MLSLIQPTFANSDPSDSRLKSVTSFGSVVVETADEFKLGNYNMLLKVCSERYTDENDCEDLDFKIEVVPCINVYGYSETEIASIQYTQGQGLYDLFEPVYKNRTDCANSVFSIDDGGIGNGLSIA